VRSFGALSVLVLLNVSAAACASGKSTETHTFFQNEEDLVKNPVEFPFPELDQPAANGLGRYLGVTVLGGALHFSRPANWQIRRGSTAPEHRYVEYVSPSEFIFGVYQRSDSTSWCTSWSDVLSQYEADAKKRGVEFEGKAIPTVGDGTQGREYILRRKVKGQRAPYENTSREFIFQGKHSWALVEVVHQGHSNALIEGEVLRALERLSVR
jgi:hypothetical protein